MNTVTIVIETLTTGTGFNIFYQNMGQLFYLFTKKPGKYLEVRNKQIPDNVTVVEVDTTNEKTVYTKIKDLGLKQCDLFFIRWFC